MSEEARGRLAELHDELAARIAEAAERTKVPGVAVGVMLDGVEDFVYHGVTSVDQPMEVDAGTLFQIGSTTKTYTATAIMLLEQQGKLELDAPVRRYLPDFSVQDEDAAANVTVLQLLNHMAGWSGDFSIDTGYGDDALALFIAAMADCAQEAPLGTAVSYNNASLSVAGRIIEVLTEQTYEAAMLDYVFWPLGLHEHHFFPWDIMTHRFAAGHALKDGELYVTPWYESRAGHPPGAETVATVRDQLSYARFHMGMSAGPLSKANRLRMQQPTTPEGMAQYGISWALTEFAGAHFAGHGGSCRGHQSGFQMLPEAGYAIAINTNARHGLELIHEIDIWAREAYLGLVEALPDPIPLTPELVADLTGVYDSHTGALTIVQDGDALLGTVEINPELDMSEEERQSAVPPLPMVVLPGDKLLITGDMYKGLQVGIVRDDTGRVTGINLGRIMTKRKE